MHDSLTARASTPLTQPQRDAVDSHWRAWMLAMMASALLSTLSATLGLSLAYAVFKPLTMVIAIIWVLKRRSIDTASTRFTTLFVLALLASLAGDVFLLFPGFFIPGLVAFLAAHVAYIALFSMNVGLFPRWRPLLATLAIGALMYAFLWWGGLPPGLRWPVAAYVVVIAGMAAQALGRAAVLGDAPARAVALGACIFMLSDALLATNRFVTPLPLAQLWVLGTYYAAQILIVRFTRLGLTPR